MKKTWTLSQPFKSIIQKFIDGMQGYLLAHSTIKDNKHRCEIMVLVCEVKPSEILPLSLLLSFTLISVAGIMIVSIYCRNMVNELTFSQHPGRI
ncbi:MAG: hypothetical protein JXA44_00260 [Methanospirillaceae archaeon]|nr:hypothetical protein [Methanospirillaceae archaeon]